MIRKTLLYALATIALLYAARYLHYRGLLRQQQGYYAKYSTCFFKENHFNVLFLGSSRAEMHYNTALFDSITGLNSFNLSLAGATPQVAFAAFKAYLLHSRAPDYMVYEVDYHALKHRSRGIKEFNNYFPFLQNPVLLQEFNAIDRRMKHFYYNPCFSFPYTGFKNLSTSLHGWLGIPNSTDSLYYKGYFKEQRRPPLNFIPEKKYYAFINPTDRSYLDSIILLCRQNSIKLCLASSPVFGGGAVELANKKQMISQLKNIAGIHHLQYFDLSSLPFCNNRHLFIDHYHLNYRGALKFTAVFGDLFNNKIANNSLKER